MIKYELVFVVDSRLSDGDKSDVARQVSDLISKFGGQNINSSVWLERHKMAFSMKKAWEGTYYLVKFEINGSEVARLRRELMINERILRCLLININEEQKVAA